jgi:hypothetical protein
MRVTWLVLFLASFLCLSQVQAAEGEKVAEEDEEEEAFEEEAAGYEVCAFTSSSSSPLSAL